MSYIETSTLKNSTIMLLYSEKDEILLDPDYQRMGGVWTREKKQLLIDSILNDYDIPKIYFHILDQETFKNTGKKYAVIDGRQRLETIWEFLEGKFTLSNSFEFQRDLTADLSGLSYEDIAKQYPKIRIIFDSFVLPVVTVITEDNDIDLIEDMFSRLNEAVPLNAAEKRNAIGGRLVAEISSLSEHPFFTRYVRFSNKRFQHKEVSARMILVENCIARKSRLIDTKKVYLDDIAKRYKTEWDEAMENTIANCKQTLDHMIETFSERDELLAAQGNMVVYYLTFRCAAITGQLPRITRRALLDFREKLKVNRINAEQEYAESSYDLLEYDRLTQQGTNDASNIKERLSILADFLNLDIPDQLLSPTS